MTTVVTKVLGGTAKPVGTLYIEPDLQVEDAGTGTDLDGGLNAPFVADLLSACLAHERCGVHLYRSIAGRSTMPDLRERYEALRTETETHVALLEALISDTGGNPMYVSPAARATEGAAARLVETTWVLDGSLDTVTAELAMLEAVLLAETKNHDNWELLGELADAMTAGSWRDSLQAAVDQVLNQEDDPLGWARETRRRMLYVAATGSEPPAATPAHRDEAADDAAVTPDSATVTKEELYHQAKDLDVPGRGAMTKDELAAAVAAAKEGDQS
jgi:rubrerythrin